MTDSGPIVDQKRVCFLATEIATFRLPVIILHGTGAFGKPPALKHGYMNGCISAARANIVAEVAAELAHLETAFTDCLNSCGMSVFRLPGMMIARHSDDAIHLFSAEPILKLLERNLTPIISGGFVFASNGGFSVCSSDEIAAQLAVELHSERLIFVTNVRGVYQDHGRTAEVHSELSLDNKAALTLIEAVSRDVTDGMLGKIKAGFRAVENGVPTFIIDGRVAGNISAVISGAPFIGTRLRTTM